MEPLRLIYRIAFALVLLGGLNWFFLGLFEKDIVMELFGEDGADSARIVYSIVGIATLVVGFLKAKDLMENMPE